MAANYFHEKNLLACFPVLLLDLHLSGVVYFITRRANVAQPYAIVTKQRYILKGWGVGKKLWAPRSTHIELINFAITTVDKEKLQKTFKTNWITLIMFIEKQHLNRTIRKVLGGVGNFSAAWVSFVNISLVWIFLGQCMIFLGFLCVRGFVSFNFPLHDYFLYFVCPSSRPSLTRKLLS